MGTVSGADFLGLSLQDRPHRRAQDKKRNELGESAGGTVWGRGESGLCFSDSGPGTDFNNYINDHIMCCLKSICSILETRKGFKITN